MALKKIQSFLLMICLSVGAAMIAPALAETASNNSSSVKLSVKDLQRLATAIAQIERYYVEPVDEKKLISYAISGMLSNLDPHSDYLDASAMQDLEVTTTGRFGGIGIEVVPESGLIKIISPIDNTPAYKAGIKAGDMIVRINGKLVGDMTMREAIDLIRGEPGSKVQLTIIRQNEKKPLEINVTREIIKYQTIKAKLLDNNYGYIRLSFFQSDTSRDLRNAITQLKQEAKGGKLSGVILDMRNNPGGLLDSAIDVSNMLLDSKHLKYGGLIVYTKGRIPSSDIQSKANGSDLLSGVPMVVLINEGSASAAEIVAGALKDQNRATLVGERSFGKGSVQTVLPIDNTSMIKLTTALYYTPSGRSIQAEGIQPDIVVADLKIPQATNSEEGLISISEADLNRHLANGNTTKPQNLPTGQVKVNSQVQDLLYSDFQLYEALNVLKGLAAAANTNTQ
ncbi:MAG: S41 family peptidase [Gammaproteobacteria bacterium]